MVDVSREEPVCAICGFGILTNLVPDMWLQDAVAIKGPRSLDKDLQASSHPDELLIRHTATGYHPYEGFWGHLTLLPSEEIVAPHREDENGYMFHGFHSSCTSIARQFIQLSPTTRLESFCDIWITLNARYSKDPGDHVFASYAPSIPQKTGRGTYTWEPYEGYYLTGNWSRTAYEWWKYDPLHIPDLTARFLENLQCRPLSPSTESSQFQNNLTNLPRELLDKITDYLRYEPMGLQPTYMLPQSCWKQIFVSIPFLWDLDVQQVHQFPHCPTDSDKEWDWEHLVRLIVARPARRPISTQDEDFMLWDYGQVGLDLPLGFTNRRRIWQILDDMDPKELDDWDDPDLIVCDDELDSFVARTVRDRLNVENPYAAELDCEFDWGDLSHNMVSDW